MEETVLAGQTNAVARLIPPARPSSSVGRGARCPRQYPRQARLPAVQQEPFHLLQRSRFSAGGGRAQTVLLEGVLDAGTDQSIEPIGQRLRELHQVQGRALNGQPTKRGACIPPFPPLKSWHSWQYKAGQNWLEGRRMLLAKIGDADIII